MRFLALHRLLYMVTMRKLQNFRMQSERAFQTFCSIIPTGNFANGQKRSIEYELKPQLKISKRKKKKIINFNLCMRLLFSSIYVHTISPQYFFMLYVDSYTEVYSSLWILFLKHSTCWMVFTLLVYPFTNC